LKKKYYVYPETEYHQEELEIKHSRGQNTLVALTIFVMMLLTIGYMIFSQYEWRPILGFALSFFAILIVNTALISYARENEYFYKFNKYITSILFFTIIVSLIIYFKSPSFIPLLFVSYAVCSIYKDTKVLQTITIYFIFAIIILIINYKNVFEFQSDYFIVDLAVMFFIFLFLMMLLLSNFIIIKEKTFFYNNIAHAKEKEFRALNLLMDFATKQEHNIAHDRDYYQDTLDILTEFSQKMDIPNIFIDKINILKLLEQKTAKQKIQKEYPQFTKSDIERLEKLLINQASPLRRITQKIKHTHKNKTHAKEMFSATHFQSFNKQNDSIETKIVCFIVFYAALKKGLPGFKALNNDELHAALINSNFHYFIDPKVIKIYKENYDVFNTIVNEIITGGDQS